VSPAPQPDARHARPAAARERLDVIEFEELLRRAAAAALAHERALAAMPHRALHVGGDVP